jgi:DNA modification methylase
MGLLRVELQQLSVEQGFDVTLTGFETVEIDNLLGSADDDLDEADQAPEIDRSQPAVSRLNDLWRIGKHFVLCADATKSESYDRLLQGQKANLVFTDPPYNVPIEGHVSGLGRNHHREFAMASGEMTEGEFTDFLESVFRNLATFSTDGSLHYVCMDWRHAWEVLTAGRKAYTEYKNLCVWNKTNGGMGSLYRSKHELVFLFKNGNAPHVNNVELGKHDRYRTNVWDYAGVNTFRANRDEELAAHPTVKPVRMVADAIRDVSNRKAVVLDAFAGSGTTLVAPEQTGRRGYPQVYRIESLSGPFQPNEKSYNGQRRTESGSAARRNFAVGGRLSARVPNPVPEIRPTFPRVGGESENHLST